jgi:hypothetical protein
MYRTTSKTCHYNEATYAGVPAFVNGVEQLDNGIAAIGQNAQQQLGTISEGVSKDKHQAVDTLALVSVKVANAIYVYAIDTNNKTLQAKVNINKSAFYNRHANEVLVLAKNITAEAHTYAAELLSYGIDADTIAALDTAVAAFESLLVKPQTTIGERKIYTSNIKQLYAQTDSVLYDRLDKLIVLFKTSAPDFYAAYKSARNIVSPARKRDDSKAASAAAGSEEQA